ncbi:hypothetical protein DPMN_037332 [Dreissena polymorpha]|uniref:Uncharacterized protein n=1 Tax=Dreissena polymorpha TaxID=45954 RepID=A0A9D4MF62_DREPO|nr:hypothetical protein DPMN_037332 [Dreissena polymorpha]
MGDTSRGMDTLLNTALTRSTTSSSYEEDDTEEEDKDAYYDALQSVLEDISQHDVLMLLGNFNAKTWSGCDHRQREETSQLLPTERLGHRRDPVRAQGDPQTDMDITRQQDPEPDRPHHHHLHKVNILC